MTPLGDLEGGSAFVDPAVGSNSVTPADIFDNADHPGVEEAYAHVLFYNKGALERTRRNDHKSRPRTIKSAMEGALSG